MALTTFLAASCAGPPLSSPSQSVPPSRTTAIPAGAIKMTPGIDPLPPVLHSSDYSEPVPLGSAINTAGAEDSPFVMPDGNTLYFFFTPATSVPPEKQLFDGVTGIYVSKKQNGEWTDAQRVVLQDKNKVALDGGVFAQGNKMWFVSAREGNYRGVDIWTAQFKDERWTDWRNAGKKLNVDYQVGELHITADGNEMYFHSSRAGGEGGLDIWVTKKVNGEWQEPENVSAVNTPGDEGWPFITQDGQELWFTRTYMGSPAIFRSKKIGDGWGEPELIISQFAAEPSLDNQGNIYFAHHFVKDGKIIEADIYVAYRK